ncbi:VWA domain-containing protein [Georgenia faecalis]|uniref:VWA domain-containing protein n=1 Tax=Georgenia faecalis TaxID=2483799 RepID=A0ABV9D7C1_9MICO|nr:VWA domain-containing protein [Georgenia faecalis]
MVITDIVVERPWLVPVVLGLVLVAAVAGWFLRRPRRRSDAVRWIANSRYLASLPAYAARMRVLRAGLGVMGVLLAVTALGSALLLARPIERQVRDEVLATRDIVLCLDVSGSMIEFDTEIVEKFSEMVEGFDGERIALSVWNSTSRTVFPLTDDYDLVRDELDAAAEALDVDLDAVLYDPDDLAELEEFIAGTVSLDQEASSLVGDGLATCALAFDETATDRSRSIIMATDNVVLGTPIYELEEAATLAAERDVRLYGLFAADPEFYSAANEESYRTAVTERGGLFYQADDPEAVEAIIEDVDSQQAVELDADPEVVITDRPEDILWLAVVGVAGLLLLGWRLRT